MREAAWIDVELYAESGVIPNGRLLVAADGTVAAAGDERLPIPSGVPVHSGKGARLVPGFIDVHVHGGNGFGMMAGTFEALDGMSRFLAEQGTTAFLATTSTADMTMIRNALRVAGTSIGRTSGAELAGIHLEGPYLDVKRRGAQNADHLRRPTVAEVEQLMADAGGHIRLVTLAPEIEGGLEAVRRFAELGATVSAGHTDATYAEMSEAVRAGVSHTTHHFNGMSPLHHREPGAAGAGLDMPELTIELICDGVHVHPAVVKLALALKTPDRVCLITDAVPPAGLPDGVYDRVVVKDGIVRLLDGSSLAGSSLRMLDGLKNAIAYTGYTLEQLLPSLTTVPARQAKLDDVKGSLRPGKHADFLLLGPELQLLATYVRGREVYRA